MRKRFLWWAGTVAVAFVVHVLAGREMASQDVIQALFKYDHTDVTLLVVALAAARAFLYFLAPGWLLHIVVAGAIERYRDYRERYPAED
jgi:hypothetical protein